MVYGCCENCVKKWQTVHRLRWDEGARFAYLLSLGRQRKNTQTVQLGHIDTNVWFLFSGLFISSTFLLFFTHWFPYMLIRRIECSSRLDVSGSEYWSCWYFIFVGCQQICTLNEFIGMPEKKREMPIRMEFIRMIGSEQKDWNKKIGPIVKKVCAPNRIGPVRNICSCQQTVVSSAPPFFTPKLFPFFNSLYICVCGCECVYVMRHWSKYRPKREHEKMLKT